MPYQATAIAGNEITSRKNAASGSSRNDSGANGATFQPEIVAVSPFRSAEIAMATPASAPSTISSEGAKLAPGPLPRNRSTALMAASA